MSPRRLVVTLCTAEILTMVAAFTYPALIPRFIAEWSLTNAEAGWIGGVYFAGYTCGVPLLSALTDRVDPRRVYLVGASLGAAAAFGFALLADGFWTAILFRTLAGLGLAGTYMPGLKLLVDRYRGERQSRAVAFYTSSFSLGTAASFFLAGHVAGTVGWRAAFTVGAVAALAAAALVGLAIRPQAFEAAPSRGAATFDVRPVLRNRAAMGFVVAYGVHNWELFVFRTWLVPFLAFSIGLQAADAWTLEPTVVATIAALVSVAASISGNELAVVCGRERVVSIVMIAGAAFSCVVGLAAPLPYAVVVVVLLVYNALTVADSAAITAGAVAWAEPERRGATLAVHAVSGFGFASVGPPLAGWVLDLTGGGSSTVSWTLAFAAGGLISVGGPVALRLTRRARRATSGAAF